MAPKLAKHNNQITPTIFISRHCTIQCYQITETELIHIEKNLSNDVIICHCCCVNTKLSNLKKSGM